MADKTDFPTKGDDQEITLRNSKHPQFDYNYALKLREDYPEIWRKGGNIRGNSAFTNWGKARKGDNTSAVKSWIKEREAWIARHKGDFRLAGVVAQIKWGTIGSRGESYMKNLVNDAKKKLKKDAGVKIEQKRAMTTFNEIASDDDDQLTYKGVKSKVVKGYIATWDRDRANDKFHKGAFADSLKEWKEEGRDPKVKDMHGKSIGVYPIDKMFEDDIGLFGEAYIDYEIQQGQEAYSKAKMGIYDRLSVGFSADPETTEGEFPFGRDIYKAHIWEGSLVDEPMNIAAKITSVKCIQEFQDFEIADIDRKWNAKEAKFNVMEWAQAEDAPNENYKSAFLVAANTERFSGVKMQIADIVDGQLMVIPKALFKAASMLMTGKGIDGMTDEQKQDAKEHIDGYYAKLGIEPPWGKKMLGELLGSIDAIKEMSLRDIEQILKESGCSDSQAKCLISSIKGVEQVDQDGELEQEEKSLNEETETETVDDEAKEPEISLSELKAVLSEALSKELK